jgi:hypothetical protein
VIPRRNAPLKASNNLRFDFFSGFNNKTIKKPIATDMIGSK